MNTINNGIRRCSRADNFLRKLSLSFLIKVFSALIKSELIDSRSFQIFSILSYLILSSQFSYTLISTILRLDGVSVIVFRSESIVIVCHMRCSSVRFPLSASSTSSRRFLLASRATSSQIASISAET